MNNTVMINKNKKIKYVLDIVKDEGIEYARSHSSSSISNNVHKNLFRSRTSDPGYLVKSSSLLEATTDLIFVFACPLRFKKDQEMKPLQQLDSKSEFEMIDRILSKLNSRKVKYSKTYATNEHLLATWVKRPSVLHFSGHGELGADNKKHEDYLIIEDANMEAQRLKANEIKEFLVKSNKNIQLAVILSCHSESIGNIFINCGISHVICIKRDEEIKDMACLIFTRAFYSALFDGIKQSVCEAYQHAICVLTNSQKNYRFAKEEAKKFMLLHKNGTVNEHSVEC